MKKGDKLHGFIVREVRALPEIKATLFHMEYEKNRAELIWLDRQDDNKTFAISFKTIPQDDTGVFHILEHSVLCGSEKYPVKEPFVELLKSSLQTFLNAFTFPDKTMYPVCSRNDKDFLQLMDVYMDAVLHPLCVQNPLAFRQEGWHFEFDEDGAPVYNGVVYNEMKGAYASEDTLLMAEMSRLLFPDNCYRFESGGHPAHIPELTYENYVTSHRRFYHPSNAKIFLDGSVDLDAVLAKLDGFLKPYEALTIDTDIPMQAPVCPEEKYCAYSIDPAEDPDDRVILSGGWVFARYDELEKSIACSILAAAMCDSNETPLKYALLSKGLAEDVELQVMEESQQSYALLVVRNTSEEKKDQVWDTVYAALKDLADGGLDKERLGALLNNFEYASREKEAGGMPRGLVYAMDAMETWNYGGDPAQNLYYGHVFASLRDKLDTDYFENLLREVFLENPHQARLCMLPSQTLEDEKAAAEEEKLQKIRAGWTDGDMARIRDEYVRLRAFQDGEDSPEQIATLPTLSINDIEKTLEKTAQEILAVDGVTVLHQPLETDGILHAELYFSIEDIPLEQMSLVSFFSSLLSQMETERYDTARLENVLRGNLGRFDVAPVAVAAAGQTETCIPYLAMRVSVLEQNKEKAIELVGEILNRSRFTDTELIAQLLRQGRLGMERQIAMNGNAFAARRITGSFSAKGAVEEAWRGIDMLRWVQQADDTFAAEPQPLCDAFAELEKRLFSRRRVTVSITGELDREWIEKLLSVLHDRPAGEPVSYAPKPLCREGFQIPAEIGFAAKAANLTGVGAVYSGTALVAAKILTYGYLWNSIRVKGGAYGTKLAVTNDGDVSVTSYRDPGAARSLTDFDGVGAALRAFCDSDESVERYIISTVSDIRPLLPTRIEGVREAVRHLSGATQEERQKLYDEVLHTTKEDLRAFSEVLDRILAEAGVCVVGGRSALDACGDKLSSISAIQ